jgi:hypothetical protein
MGKKAIENYNRKRIANLTYLLFDITRKEKAFVILVAVLLFVCGLATPFPAIGMWVGFALAGYSAIANDSIQTIGTFIASNAKRPWWILWLFMGVIFLLTVTYSWVLFDGDVSHQRLTSKGFDQAPTSFNFLQLAAPVILLVLTRLRMPVSTTFLLLSIFSADVKGVTGIIFKSWNGYIIAFLTAIVVWFIVSKFVKTFFKGKPQGWWIYAQWIISGALWSVWIAQDAANIAVFLPRSLSLTEFLVFSGYIFLGLGLLFYMKGDKIQQIVTEKAGVTDVRAATIVDLVYACLLYYFKVISTVPISTTWVFIGLLGGRELAISFTKNRQKRRIKSMKRSLKLLGRDMLFAAIGLLISILLAIAINPHIREELF